MDYPGGKKMRLRFKATHVVLAMLCIMYFITYIDRVNIGTAASEIQKELHLSNTQLGLVFSAFAYPYLLFQVIGGSVGDRVGPRQTLLWRGLICAAATIAQQTAPGAMEAAAAPDVAGHADLFLLRLDAVAVSQLVAVVLQEQL